MDGRDYGTSTDKMSYINFHKASSQEKELIFRDAARKANLPVYAIEKDWWVVQALRTIFGMEIGKHLLFKGGTSLSKAWGLIDRFSEDIDLALNREYLGFGSGLISKSQVRKLRTSSYEFIKGTFVNKLMRAFQESGIKDLKFDFENLGDNDQDPISILIYYPPVVPYAEYIMPRIKIEIGSRSMRDPFSLRPIRSIVGEVFSDRPFADNPINIPCVNPERTYLEKLFLLHEEFQKPVDTIRVNRLSRHIYDIYMIAKSEYRILAHNKSLIRDIIQHRERFNPVRGVNYDLHYPPHLNSIPPDNIIKAWEDDYQRMRESMIYGESPTFEKLMDAIEKELKQYNKNTHLHTDSKKENDV